MFHSVISSSIWRPSVAFIAIGLTARLSQGWECNPAIVLCKVVQNSNGHIEKLSSVKLEVLDFDGKVLQTSKTDAEGKHFFKVTPSTLPIWIRATYQGSSKTSQVMVTHFTHQPKLERSFQTTIHFSDANR